MDATAAGARRNPGAGAVEIDGRPEEPPWKMMHTITSLWAAALRAARVRVDQCSTSPLVRVCRSWPDRPPPAGHRTSAFTQAPGAALLPGRQSLLGTPRLAICLWRSSKASRTGCASAHALLALAVAGSRPDQLLLHTSLKLSGRPVTGVQGPGRRPHKRPELGPHAQLGDTMALRKCALLLAAAALVCAGVLCLLRSRWARCARRGDSLPWMGT